MRQPTPQQRVDSILRYLSKMQRVAEALHDRNGAGDYSHAWLIVMQRFYGRYRPVRFPQPAIGIPRLTPTKRKTAEQTLIALAPLRKVVKRVPTYWRAPGSRQRHVIWSEHLECGHTIDSIFYSKEDPRPRHRKCRACVPPAKSRVLKFPREVAI